MHYIIYQITNLINNMIYIGQHQTKNPNDSYMGSGLLIQKAIKKYGKHNFKKTILFDFSSFEEMNNKEAELVNEEFIQREDTYNLTIGGDADKGYALRNRKVMNNGIEQKFVKIIDVPIYIANGWELGILPTNQIGKSKGFKWIRNIELNEQHLINENEANNYLKLPGWELGQLPRKRCKLPMLSERFKNYRIITKNDIEKHVPYWEVDAYLLDGWILGSKKSLAKTLWHYSRKNFKWMHKDNLFQQQVLPEDIETYLADGWTFGRLFHPSNTNKTKYIPDHVKAYFSALWTGSKFMNDGTITKQVLKKDIDLFLALGWKFGGLNNQNRVFVNNGKNCYSIKKDELDKYLENGFVKGKIPYDNGMSKYKNSITIHNIETHEIKRLKENDPMPAGYIQGLYVDQEIFEKMSKRTKGNKYIMNDITGEVTHIHQGDPLPDGWHFGRHKRQLTDKQKENIHKKASERTWYTNGKENSLVPWKKEQEYIDRGWWKGRSNFQANHVKRLCYNNGVINKMILPNEEQEYIAKGWKRGQVQKYAWYTDGKNVKLIQLNEEKEYIAKGWKRGRLPLKKLNEQSK